MKIEKNAKTNKWNIHGDRALFILFFSPQKCKIITKTEELKFTP
jgi:hypothetical protein